MYKCSWVGQDYSIGLLSNGEVRGLKGIYIWWLSFKPVWFYTVRLSVRNWGDGEQGFLDQEIARCRASQTLVRYY